MNKIYTISYLALISLFGSAAYAAPQGSAFCPSTLRTIADLLNFGTCLISKSLIPLLIAVALICFIYGVVKFIYHADDEAKREEGKKFIMYGILGLFVMVSIWGLVNILSNTFGVNNAIPLLPSNY